MSFTFPRMLVWLVLTIVLMGLALLLQAKAPGNLIAVTLYKAHLLSLGGWGGYWLDRALFPYARPHCFDLPTQEGKSTKEIRSDLFDQLAEGRALGYAALRRSIIVAACLITVGLGA